MKTFSSIILLFILIFVTFSFDKVYAQTPTPIQSCDLCGWCKPGTTRPYDWPDCMQCLFPTTTIPGDGSKPLANTKYPSHPETPKQWTVFGCLDVGAGGFVNQIYKLIIAFGSGFAFLAIIYGGFKVLTASGDPIQVSAGKHIIMGAISGILLIIFSIFLLRLVGVEIIRLPGFG
ncbi:hypothetical protein HYT02_02525 [Candidatus Gottesmanbacteria bacterium]|nr:hypothetical protein [Candidatus Gottesmanbacteria bacterium]